MCKELSEKKPPSAPYAAVEIAGMATQAATRVDNKNAKEGSAGMLAQVGAVLTTADNTVQTPPAGHERQSQ